MSGYCAKHSNLYGAFATQCPQCQEAARAARKAIKFPISAVPLRQLLEALNGEPHLIREIQATRNTDRLMGEPNPIDELIDEFNAENARQPGWQIRVTASDDIIPQPDEITALREANEINKAMAELERTDNSPFVIAIVEQAIDLLSVEKETAA